MKNLSYILILYQTSLLTTVRSFSLEVARNILRRCAKSTNFLREEKKKLTRHYHNPRAIYDCTRIVVERTNLTQACWLNERRRPSYQTEHPSILRAILLLSAIAISRFSVSLSLFLSCPCLFSFRLSFLFPLVIFEWISIKISEQNREFIQYSAVHFNNHHFIYLVIYPFVTHKMSV